MDPKHHKINYESSTTYNPSVSSIWLCGAQDNFCFALLLHCTNDQFCNRIVVQFNKSDIASDKWEPVVSTPRPRNMQISSHLMRCVMTVTTRAIFGPKYGCRETSCHGEILELTEFYCLSWGRSKRVSTVLHVPVTCFWINIKWSSSRKHDPCSQCVTALREDFLDSNIFS